MFLPYRPRLNPGICPNCKTDNGIGSGDLVCAECGVTFDGAGRHALLPKMALRWKIWFGFLFFVFVGLPAMMMVLSH